MMDIVIGVAICAALFVIYGFFPHRGCTGHCAGCTGACGRYQGEDHHES